MRIAKRLSTAVLTAAVALAAIPGVASAVPAGASQSSSPSLQQSGACQSHDISRFADCQSGIFGWNLREGDPLTGPVVGTVDATFTISERVAWDSRAWTAHYTVYVHGLTGVATVGTTVSVVPECAGACTVSTTLPQAVPVSINAVLSGDITFSSPGPERSTSRQVINLYAFHPAVVGTGSTRGDPRTELGQVRCDDATRAESLGRRAEPGFVMSDFIPTFVINSPEFGAPPAPLHAAFVASAQNDPRTQRWGAPGSGKPLVREVLSRDDHRKKRQAVCPRRWPRHPSPPGTLSENWDTCDEYPYSSTRQGTPTYAVTEHIPAGDNNAAGGQLAEFYDRYHILDADAFYVQP